MKIAIIKEGKNPPDKRTPLAPVHCKKLLEQFPSLEIYVQPSSERCFPLEDYLDAGCKPTDDPSGCDILVGVKEVPIENIVPSKTYFFFSHTAKMQLYNKPLLKAAIDKKIRLIDYEYLVNEQGQRVVAFGRWAGIVGAHNGLIAWAKRTRAYNLLPAYHCKDMDQLFTQYDKVQFPPMKILITGTGRVAHGAKETLLAAGIKELDVENYLDTEPDEAVFCMADIKHFYRQKFRGDFLMEEFFQHPDIYEIHFKHFLASTDLLINAIYWDSKAPVYFQAEDMKSAAFRLRSIADITCDIEGSVPITVRPSEIADPVYGWSIEKNEEATPYQEDVIDIMAVDNLPCELPRNASLDFGNAMLAHVMTELITHPENSAMLNRATIVDEGELNEPFAYLDEYLAEE